MNTEKRQISLYATPEEVAKIQLLRQRFGRTSNSDLLRMLIWCAEKFLSANIAMPNFGLPAGPGDANGSFSFPPASRSLCAGDPGRKSGL